jgi:hypothetical protein
VFPDNVDVAVLVKFCIWNDVDVVLCMQSEDSKIPSMADIDMSRGEDCVKVDQKYRLVYGMLKETKECYRIMTYNSRVHAIEDILDENERNSETEKLVQLRDTQVSARADWEEKRLPDIDPEAEMVCLAVRDMYQYSMVIFDDFDENGDYIHSNPKDAENAQEEDRREKSFSYQVWSKFAQDTADAIRNGYNVRERFASDLLASGDRSIEGDEPPTDARFALVSQIVELRRKLPTDKSLSVKDEPTATDTECEPKTSIEDDIDGSFSKLVRTGVKDVHSYKRINERLLELYSEEDAELYPSDDVEKAKDHEDLNKFTLPRAMKAKFVPNVDGFDISVTFEVPYLLPLRDEIISHFEEDRSLPDIIHISMSEGYDDIMNRRAFLLKMLKDSYPVTDENPDITVPIGDFMDMIINDIATCVSQDRSVSSLLDVLFSSVREWDSVDENNTEKCEIDEGKMSGNSKRYMRELLVANASIKAFREGKQVLPISADAVKVLLTYALTVRLYQMAEAHRLEDLCATLMQRLEVSFFSVRLLKDFCAKYGRFPFSCSFEFYDGDDFKDVPETPEEMLARLLTERVASIKGVKEEFKVTKKRLAEELTKIEEEIKNFNAQYGKNAWKNALTRFNTVLEKYTELSGEEPITAMQVTDRDAFDYFGDLMSDDEAIVKRGQVFVDLVWRKASNIRETNELKLQRWKYITEINERFKDECLENALEIPEETLTEINAFTKKLEKDADAAQSNKRPREEDEPPLSDDKGKKPKKDPPQPDDPPAAASGRGKRNGKGGSRRR